MGLCLKTTAGLLLLVQAFHLASLQNSTYSPERTIKQEWLRDHGPNTAGSENAAVTGEETENDQGADASESSNEYSSGIASGFMMVLNEEENVTSQNGATDTSDNRTAVTITVPPTSPTNVTTERLPDATVSPTTVATEPTNSNQINVTEGKDEFHNSTTPPQHATTHMSSQNSSIPSHSSHTNLTTLAPETNATQKSTTKPDKDTGLTNATESATTTTATNTTEQEKKETTSTSSSTTVIPSPTTEASPVTTTAAAPITPEKANKTDKDAAPGSNSERDVTTGTQKSKRHGAWGAVLGTAVAVTVVGLVAYVILKKRHGKGFSHRKLVEDFPSDPVLRLDNSAPLDLNFGLAGSAYYNPGLQGDNIQMANFPGRRLN